MAKEHPIKPSEIAALKEKQIPDAVIECFNELIAQKFSGCSSIVYQKDVVAKLVALGFKSNEIYRNHWLDVESIYEKAGWKVAYDKPAYNESYDAFFRFEKK